MRGIDTTQSAMFSYVSPEQRVPKDHPLRTIRPLCDVALKALSREFDRMYSDVGRPSIAPEKLLRALLLQILYTMGGCSFKQWSKKRVWRTCCRTSTFPWTAR